MISDLEFAERLYVEYEEYLTASLKTRRLKHKDILPLINNFKKNKIFKVKTIGASTEGRELNLISFGQGKTKIFLWSQMHGDEATATMAIFDILNFLSSKNNFQEIKKWLTRKLTIHFLPMVNPDGAEIFQRRNIFNIDINRDAVRLASKEAKILMETFVSLKADFGFNLHDQDVHYSAGNSFKPATISFLAPPENDKGKSTNVRNDAERLISKLFKILNSFIPGHVAKYSDEFEPRAFGDNFQKLGTSTILIESGGWKNDPEKQFIRKLNFIVLLSAFKSIAERSYKKESLKTYESIPFNKENLRDVIIRNVTIKKNGKKSQVDLAINFNEININNSTEFYYKSELVDIGDLSTYYGYEDHDFNGMTVEPGKTFPDILNNLDDLENLNTKEMYKKGYTNILMKSVSKKIPKNLPFNLILGNNPPINDQIKLNEPASLLFKKDGRIQFVMINGFLHNLKYASGENIEGLIVY